MDLFALTGRLSAIPGVAGRETLVADAIAEIAGQYTDDIRRDALGNVLVTKKGAKTPEQPIMLAAHMDEVGFLVSHVTSDGLVQFVAAGGLYGQTLAGRTLWFPRANVRGVLGRAPVHLQKDKESVPALDSFYCDIGADSKEAALAVIRLGDMAVFNTEPRDFGDNMFMGKALDDRLGCALLLKLLEQELPCDTVFAFTVQEELGLRGAATAAFAVRPGYAIVVDVAGGADNAGFQDAAMIARTGEGPIISFADAATVYDFELYETVCGIADTNGISWQTKSRISGGTDAGSIHKTASGCRTIGISVTGRNIHTAATAIHKGDARQALALIEKALEYLADVR